MNRTTSQTRLVSFIEALLNTLIGFIVSFIAWPIAAYLTGIEYTFNQHWLIVGFFTVISVARSYAIRRLFNNGLHLVAVRMVKHFFKTSP